jgi:FlaG/FlaF family flagellin (archaellin)
MQQGTLCPRCGRVLRYIGQYQNWYCDNCRIYPYMQQMPIPYYYPPQKEDSSKTIIIVVVIILLIFVVLPIILAAVLYFMVSGIVDDIELTPSGNLNFEEDPYEPGVYIGGFTTLTDRIDLNDLTMTITDNSQGSSDTVSIRDGVRAQVIGGLSCTFSDVNDNDRLDTIDTFRINNGAPGDSIRIVYEPTGGVIASDTLS